jgi:diacylglycerol kinase (ATP)
MYPIHLAYESVHSRDPTRTLLLANPLARNVDRNRISIIAGLLGLHGRSVLDITRDGSALSLATRAVRDGVASVVAAGGDGTVHQIVQALAGSDTALGIVPLGTSNDLARRLGISAKFEVACRGITQSRAVPVDVINIDGSRVATVGGYGLPAHIVAAANDLKSRPALRPLTRMLSGTLYPLVAAQHIMARGSTLVDFNLKPRNRPPIQTRASAILVGVADQFGGGLRLTAGRPIEPGTFSALTIHASTRAGLIGALLRLMLGRPQSHSVQYYENLTHLDIKAGALVGSFGDGECLGLKHRSVVQIEPGALRVLVPGGSTPPLEVS